MLKLYQVTKVTEVFGLDSFIDYEHIFANSEEGAIATVESQCHSDADGRSKVINCEYLRDAKASEIEMGISEGCGTGSNNGVSEFWP